MYYIIYKIIRQNKVTLFYYTDKTSCFKYAASSGNTMQNGAEFYINGQEERLSICEAGYGGSNQ
jgi:hypothetical protein